ncbi:MAG: hypothetical protein UDG94_01380 [Peptococcaceae bacterium]|nr:hypothetical protein [Peptococcaceae bacterium]
MGAETRSKQPCDSHALHAVKPACWTRLAAATNFVTMSAMSASVMSLTPTVTELPETVHRW